MVAPKSKTKPQTLSAQANRRLGALGLALLALAGAYLLALRALDTGSLQQYFLTLVLLGFGLNRLARATRPGRKAKA